MSGAFWTGTHAYCSACNMCLMMLSPLFRDAICEHGKWGCINDGKRYRVPVQPMAEVEAAQAAQPQEQAQ